MANDSGSVDQCSVVRSSKMRDMHLHGWRGLPEDFTVNLIFVLTYLTVFSTFRCMYHRRKKYLQEWNADWITFFYGDRTVGMLHVTMRINRRHEDAYLPSSLRSQADQIWNRLDTCAESEAMAQKLAYEAEMQARLRAEHEKNLRSVGNRGFFWLYDYLCISDDSIERHRGHDTLTYLLFQRYLIYNLAVVAIVSMVVLLPINATGGQARDAFERTTINAIEQRSPLLWTHVWVAIGFVVYTSVMMKLFTCMAYTQQVVDDRTILIENIPEARRDAFRLKRYIERRFENVQVTRVTHTYDVARLNVLTRQLCVLRDAVNYAQEYKKLHGEQLRVTPMCGQQFAVFSSGTGLYDALTYYRRQERKAMHIIREEVARLADLPEHAVFVQFATAHQTAMVLDRMQRTQDRRQFKHDTAHLQRGLFGWCPCGGGGGQSGQRLTASADAYNYLNWAARPAPIPEDIVWEDIVLDTNTVGITSLVLTLFLLVIFLCLSTPMVILNYLTEIVQYFSGKSADGQTSSTDKSSAFRVQFGEYFSTIGFNIVNALLSRLVVETVNRVPRATKSEKAVHVLRTMFLFLFIANYVLPSIGLISVRIWVQKVFDQNVYLFYKCLFASSLSAWFLKLLVSSTLVSNTFDLLRVVDIIYYVVDCIMYPRTEAEFARARLMVLPFNFGFSARFATILMPYTLSITYAVGCPLIPLVGLCYMTIRHFQERFQVYYLYSATDNLTADIVRTAVFIALFANVLLFLQLAGYLFTHPDTFEWAFNPGTITVIALVIYLIYLFFFGLLYRVRIMRRDDTGSSPTSSELPQPDTTSQAGGTSNKPPSPSRNKKPSSAKRNRSVKSSSHSNANKSVARNKKHIKRRD